MASAVKSLEREIDEHEHYLDSLVSTAASAKELAQQLIDLTSQIDEKRASPKRAAAKQVESLKGQREKVKRDYLSAARNFAALQARLNHMQAALIKFLAEFQALAERVATLPGKVEEAGRRVRELQTAVQQMGKAEPETQPNKNDGSAE